MNKKLMAVAVAGALAVPALAFAQASNVQVYGRVNLGLDNYRAEGATAGTAANMKARTRIYDAGSRLGFRGTESLGGGLNAVFLMESGVNVDSGNNLGQAGAANVSTGFLSSRIGHVGLQGNWGLLTFGRSNIFWGNGRNDQTAANYVETGLGGFTGTMGRGMSVGITRVSNTMQYTSPTFSGFNAVVSFSPNNQEAAVAGANADGKTWGITVQGQFGPFHGGYDWVKNTLNSPAAGAQAKTTGNKLRVGWDYQPGAQVSLFYVTSKQDNTAAVAAIDATTTGLKQKFWGLNWEHVFGNIQALAQWGKTRDITGCNAAAACGATNATQYQLAARYLMSKRTAAYVSYNQTRNDRNYNLDYTGASITATAALANGADPRIWGIGVIHNF